MRCLGAFFLFLLVLGSCSSEEKTNTSLTRFVTEDAILALEIKNLRHVKDSLSENAFLAQFGALPSYASFKKELAFLKHLPQDASGFLIFSKTKQDSLAFIYAMENQSDLFKTKDGSLTVAEKIPVENDTIRRYVIGATQIFARLVENDLLLGSSLEALLANGKLPGNYELNTAFEKAYRSSDQGKAISLFINLKKKDSLVTSFINDLPGIDFSRLNEWTSFDILGRKNQLTFNGVTTLLDSIPTNLALFMNTIPAVNTTPSFAPLQTDALVSYSFDDYAVFAKNQQAILGLNRPVDSPFKTVEEIGIIFLNGEKAILLNTFGTQDIADFLVSKRKRAIEYQGNIILEHADNSFLDTSFQPLIKDFKANYSTILENAFVFSSAKSTLQTIISNYKNEQTFLKNPNYQNALKNTTETATMLYISDGSFAKALVKPNSNLANAKIANYTLVTQLVADGNLVHSNIAVLPKDGQKPALVNESSTRFELDQPLASKPQFVSNHNTKAKEIVVQDITNALYLFSADGKRIWKKELQGKIQGGIHQVDLFKNGKLQLAFTTTNELIVLDRNGKNVSFFDKTYSGESLNALAVFDYDKKREYRFVVTQNDKVFMYDRKGKVVSGFTYKKAEAPIREAPQHMVIGKKDYLTFLLEDGSFKAVNRKGEQRVKAKEKIAFSDNSLHLHKNTFTLTDTDGKLCQIDVNGNVKRVALSLSDYHKMDANSKLFVYMNENVLSINGKKTELDLGAYTHPRIIEIGSSNFITVTDLQNQKVYLFDSKSNLVPSFPLYGTSEIDMSDIDNDGKLELVTATTENSLRVYHLN